jgi:hypothetical protein
LERHDEKDRCRRVAAGRLPASPGNPVKPGFGANLVPRNDDGSTALQPLGFTINFFGKQRTHAFVNNNGNITFDSALSTYTPFGLERTQREIIAAFFADVDTRNILSKVVTYGQDMIDGRRAFGVNFIDVGYYSSHADKLNSFQLIVVDRSDSGAGNFDIEYNYQRVVWETGDASDGVNGYGGVSASVGWSNGSGDPGTSFELDGSFIPGSFLDGARRALNRNRLNSTVPGRYVFRARNGQIMPPLTISTGCPLPSAFAGSPYVLRFSAVGGTQYRWSMVADPGAPLPAGFTLSESGNFSGTANSPATHEFTIRLTSVTEDGDQTISKRCSISVQPASLNITTGCPLPQASVGQPYSRTLQVAGGRGPYVWALAENSGPLPPGLSLTSSGVISGVPTAPGNSNVTLQVRSSDADGAAAAFKTCGLIVNAVALDLTSSCSLPSATSGVPYSQQLSVTGGAAPYEWSAVGSLPVGMTLSSAGRLEGVPGTAGNSSFTARVLDSRGSVRDQTCSLRVDTPQLEVQTACPLPNATAGQSYSQRLAVAGGAGTYSWSILGNLPPGLTLTGDGILSGFPGGSGAYGFRFLVSDSNGRSVAKNCNLFVARADFGLTSCPLPNASTGMDYSTSLRASGGVEPYFFRTTSTLPQGLTLTTGGLVSGRPRQAGTFPMTISVMDRTGKTATQPCQVTVNPTALQISGTCPLPEAKVGSTYLQRFTASGGSAPYSFRVDGRLLSGLTLSSNGTLSGTPAAIGDADFEIEVEDSQGRLVSKACRLTASLPDVPVIRMTQMSATMNAAANGPTVMVELAQPYSLPIQGDIVLTAEADTGSFDNPVNRPDPRVRFSNGLRVVPFTIPPGSRQVATQVVSTGTVASLNTVNLANVRSAGVPIYTLPTPRQFKVQRAAPVITDSCYAPVAGGVSVVVTGYSTTRQLTNATVTLTSAATATERTMTLDISGSAYDYFSTDEAVRNGGAFTLTLPFALEGDIGSASLELTNANGSVIARSLQRCR